jgi:hypothetical protein
MNLWGNDGGRTAFALIPYAKWPTAPIGVGNGYTEAGHHRALAISLPYGFTTIPMGELDYLTNLVSPVIARTFSRWSISTARSSRTSRPMPRSMRTGRTAPTYRTYTRSTSPWPGLRGRISSSMSASTWVSCLQRPLPDLHGHRAAPLSATRRRRQRPIHSVDVVVEGLASEVDAGADMGLSGRPGARRARCQWFQSGPRRRLARSG